MHTSSSKGCGCSGCALVVMSMCDAILAHETDDEEEKEEKMEEDEVAVDVLGDMAAQEEDQE